METTSETSINPNNPKNCLHTDDGMFHILPSGSVLLDKVTSMDTRAQVCGSAEEERSLLFYHSGQCSVGYCDVMWGYCDVMWGYCDVMWGYCIVTSCGGIVTSCGGIAL